MDRRRSRCAAILGVITCFLYQLNTKKQRKSREGVRQMHKDRLINGFFEKNYMKMRNIDPEQFLMCTRMTVATFDVFLELIRHKLEKISMRKPILPECRTNFTNFSNFAPQLFFGPRIFVPSKLLFIENGVLLNKFN